MRIYLDHTVYEAALDRLRFLFDEFEHVLVTFSGGKDSTGILELAITVAREKGRLPVDVMFLDQEAEWGFVINYVRRTMDRDEVRPFWLQVPFRFTDATDPEKLWLMCWEEGADWVHPRQPDSIHENIFGVDRFYKFFPAFVRVNYPTGSVASLTGVRCEESPRRQVAMTNSLTYKHLTWGRVDDAERSQYTFHPLYDWGKSDVWKAINDHGWDYTRLYDLMYQHGVGLNRMRVSGLCHESSLAQVRWMQEFEPDVWNRLHARIPGLHAVAQMEDDFTLTAKTLPWMFESWAEYRDHLLANLVTDDTVRARMAKQFRASETRYIHPSVPIKVQTKLYRAHVLAILANDFNGVKLRDFEGAYAKSFAITRETGRRRAENATRRGA